MRILVVGAGSTGGFFGACLARAGRDVTFLVRAGRAHQLQQEGLQVLSPHGDFVLTPQLVGAEHLDGPYDLILLTVKAYALEAALRDIVPAVGPGTMILPQEAAKSAGETPEEVAAIEGEMLPKMIVAGFSTVTITSVIVTSIIAAGIGR